MDMKKSDKKQLFKSKKKWVFNKYVYDEYDGEDIDTSEFSKLSPEEQERELEKLRENMFITNNEDTDN